VGVKRSSSSCCRTHRIFLWEARGNNVEPNIWLRVRCRRVVFRSENSEHIFRYFNFSFFLRWKFSTLTVLWAFSTRQDLVARSSVGSRLPIEQEKCKRQKIDKAGDISSVISGYFQLFSPPTFNYTRFNFSFDETLKWPTLEDVFLSQCRDFAGGKLSSEN
jgi:hypothetical protein